MSYSDLMSARSQERRPHGGSYSWQFCGSVEFHVFGECLPVRTYFFALKAASYLAQACFFTEDYEAAGSCLSYYPGARSFDVGLFFGHTVWDRSLKEADLLPIASRVRARLRTEALAPSQLLQCLNHLLKMAGNPKLMNPPLLQTLCEHAASNLRLLTNMANELLAAAVHQERKQIDEKLFFEVLPWTQSRAPNTYEPTACPTRQ